MKCLFKSPSAAAAASPLRRCFSQLIHASASASATQEVSSRSDAVSISNAIIRNGFDHHTLAFLRQFRPGLSQSLVVQVLDLVSDAESGVQFFMWARRQVGYCHTPPVYHALLQTLLHGSPTPTALDHFFKQIQRDDSEVLGKLLNLFVRKHCRNGRWNVALEELGRLKDFGCKPTSATYNALLQVFVRADKLDTAQLLHEEMSESGFRMDHSTLGCFSQALCKVGKWREALSLIEKEESVGDTFLYNMMVSGLCEASLFDEAMDFLDRMRSDSCLPNVATYSVLLEGCLKKKKLGRCKRILGMMISEGCYPHPKLFNSLVHVYCNSCDFSYAYKVLRNMVKCGHRPGYVVYNILIGGICGREESPSSDLLDLAEKAYGEMLGAGIVLNKVNIVNFVQCLCGAEKFERAISVVREMMSKGFVPDTSTYSKVIGFLSSFSKIEEATLLFEEMKRNGVVPDVYTYTILIVSFCKAGIIQQARNLYDEMLQNGCSPDVVTYTALMHAYLKCRKVCEADKLFEMMLKHGCVPNIVTYTALVDGHCKAGKTDKAVLIYERMKGNLGSSDVDMDTDMNIYFNVEDSTSSNRPDVFTYGALVDGLCKDLKVNEALGLLNAMQTEGCEPSIVVYNALIDGFCKAGKMDEVQAVFSKISDSGYSPTLFTYGSLINRLFKDERLDLVLKVLAQMQENSCSPDVVIYTQMIDGLCKMGKLDEAYKLLLMMEEKNCRPDVVTYTAMIDGFGKAGEVEKCLDLFREMCSKGCAPNFVTYRVLIHHCCDAGLLDEARELLNEMKQTYWPMHMGSSQKGIKGYNKAFLASLGVLNKMGKYEFAPVSSAYSIVMDKFIKAGKLEVAMELYSEIQSSPWTSMSTNTCTSLIESLSSGYNVEKGFEVFRDMINRGSAPELNAFVHLIRGLARVDRWDDAFRLSEGICHTDINWLQEEQLPDRR